MSRQDVAEYLLVVLSWPGVQCDKALLRDTVTRRAGTAGLSFVDAYLAAVAKQRNSSVFTKTLRELRGQGIDAPSPLPG